MRPRKLSLLLAGLAVALGLSGIAHAVNPNIRGRVSGQDKLLPDVYAEAAKPKANRWTWREPSPAVEAQFRTLSANLSRDVCIAATSASTAGPQEPVLMKITGGRIVPTTLAVSPKTKLVLKNLDPFPHKAYIVGNKGFSAEVIQPNGTREWTAPDGNGRYELRDELYPSVRTWVVVDPQVLQVAYPGRDGAFAFALPAGDYVLKAYFGGKRVGKSTSVVAKDRGTFELKEPLNLAEGGD
ncbi:MAG: hypothetical protein IPK71_27135 [Myxococcales bacterium]|jgi:hypothetical protein|nr:hypothetical protein [Myxococcales bacterium]